MDIHTVLSLCSGVGMLDEGLLLALESYGIRGQVVGYCEREVYAQSVLVARMADAALDPTPICDALEDLDERWRGKIDWIVAGFPCQPWSAAGKRLGKHDERWIWDDILGVIDRVQPRFIFFENVPGLIRGQPTRQPMGNGHERVVRHDGLDPILRALAERGFDAEWLHLSAAEVGAAHKRERFFLLAYASGARGGGLDAGQRTEGQRTPKPDRRGESVENSQHAIRRLLPACGAITTGESWTSDSIGGSGEALGDAECAGLERQSGSTDATGRQEPDGSTGPASRELFAPGPDNPRWRDILRDAPWLAPALTKEEAQSLVHRMAYGLATTLDAYRADKLRCIGNGVCVVQAAVALSALLHHAGLVNLEEIP